MTNPAKRPPADRGQGRKSIQGGGKSPVLQVRVTPEVKQAATLKGSAWLRKVIEAALKNV